MRGTTPAPEKPAQVPLLHVACVSDGRDHWISEAQLVDARPSGRYRAVCGRLVLPTALVTPPGRVCSACSVVLGAGRERRGASFGVLRRLVRVFVRSSTGRHRSSRRIGPAVAQETGVGA